MSRRRAAIILAAGKGTRMKSDMAKPLHAVGGRSMLDWSLALCAECGIERTVVVWGAHSPDVRDCAEAAGAITALQDPPKGTGHAVQCAQDALSDFQGDVIVLYADTPLIAAQTVEQVFQALDDKGDVAVLGFEAEHPAGYGRLVETDGILKAIVEDKDASARERQITLCNSGVLATSSSLLFELLSKVDNQNAKGEYYLTDVVGLAVEASHKARAVRGDEAEMLGVNSRADLATAEAAFQTRKRQQMMDDGVTLIAPDSVYFAHDTKIEPDVIIEPNVVFGPGVTIGRGSRILGHSHIEGATIGQNVSVGPFARLRPGAVLKDQAKVGNFVEVKKSILGEGAKVSHLTYLGDSDVGAGANIGAGTITCNYDGFLKHKTIIGEGAFIGSNTCLVAPVSVGKNAMTGTGSVISQDVPDDGLGISRARQENKPGWAARFRKMMQAKKDKASKD